MDVSEILQTARLILRRPGPADAEGIFAVYASDPIVTRYLSWPTHRTLADTRAFLAWSDAEWEKWPAGPYLVFSRDDRRLLGSTGLSFKSPQWADTGYVFAQREWRRGYASESVEAIVALAGSLGIHRLEAICHVDHRASARILEKCGFQFEGVRPCHTEFPNLAPGQKSDVFSYVRRF
jgi:ribosomal-protein-alanine N-acetyltransferase